MCGIVGRWSNRATTSTLLPRAVELLRHRGPDDHGIFSAETREGSLTLGHTRLAIIDLSDQGHQPMTSGNGRYTIVFNGELYNYRELRTELSAAGVRFQGDSDTEVLLEAWGRWGPACLYRLIGMFAFAVFDSHESTLSLVRDAFGIKPLFYTSGPREFAFASEIQPLVSVSSQTPRLNILTAYEYLVWGTYDVDERTFIDQVRQLPPGHVMTLNLNDGSTAIDRWWNPDVTETFEGSFTEAADAVRHAFLDSVRVHLRSDVPLGAALSGGIDSTAIVCAIRYLEPDAEIRTFSYVSDDGQASEREWADLVASHVGALGHEVHLTADDLTLDLEELIRAQGEPFGSTSIYASYGVMRRARDAGVTVMLEGQGADELFGGYHGYPGHRVRSMLDEGGVRGAAQFLCAWRGWPGRPLKAGMRASARQFLPSEIPRVLGRYIRSRSERPWLRLENVPIDAVQQHIAAVGHSSSRGRRLASGLRASMTGNGLPALLRHSDRNGMHFSIESRVPFLTTTQAELTLSLPERYLVSDRAESKSVLRAALRGIVPDVVLDRRDKIPFATPESRWLSAVLRERLVRVDTGCLPELIDASHARALLREVAEERTPATAQTWRLLNLLEWARIGPLRTSELET